MLSDEGIPRPLMALQNSGIDNGYRLA